MHEPSELCVEEGEIALFTAVLPQVKYNSTKMIEENTPGRSKSGMTGIFVELDTFCPCWSREVCVRRPWEKAAPGPDEVGSSSGSTFAKGGREGSWFLFVQL